MVVLNCGRITDEKELELAAKYNRCHIAEKRGDCTIGNCSTCMHCRSVHQRNADLYGHCYCTVSKKVAE